MSSACTLFGPCSCASCSASTPDTPLSVSNNPGLSSLKYRVGTFSTFRQAMLDYLVQNPASNPNPVDASQTFTLTSRASDDYAVAMLELWAYVCDVLTFYQQAIANEAYLRTATQQSSIAALAGLLGYRPAPAVAASVYLALTTSKGATAEVPAGLQTQSSPPPGQTPVIYESSAALTATAGANQLALLGPQQSLTLTQSGTLLNDDPANPVAQGARLLFFDIPSVTVSEQQVSAVTAQAIGKLVAWRGTVPSAISPGASSPYCFRIGRTFRCFGTGAPVNYLTVTISNNQPSWGSTKTTFNLPTSVLSSGPLWLDSVYTGLGAGAPVLVRYDGSPAQLVFGIIASVANGTNTVGPVSGSCTGITLTSMKGTLVDGADLRYVTIYELLGPPSTPPSGLVFADTGFNSVDAPSYASESQAVNVVDASSVAEGTDLVFASSNAQGVYGDFATLSSNPAGIVQAPGFTLGYALSLVQQLANPYTASNTSLFANIVAATQGKTQPMETLGSGDASQQWQQFALKANPVTYVPNAAATNGAESTLQVFVNGIQWQEVPTFYGHGPMDQIFQSIVGSDGTWYARFGDGVTGQRVPTGNGNVTALYRAGAGSNGNAGAGTITTILQSVSGLQSVTNPLPAYGGTDGEALSTTRQNAPVSVLTLGRAVSLRDYEALALTYLNGAITKARASWADLNDRRGVALTAAASGGQPLGPLTQPLRDFLDDHRDPNVPLTIADAALVFFVFRATINLQDGFLQSQIQAATEAALGVAGETGYVSYAQLQIGQSIYQSKLLSVLQDVPGVAWVELTEFSTQYSSGRIGFSPNGNFGPPPFPLGPPGPGHKKLEAIYINPQQIAQPSLTGVASDVSAGLTYSGGVNDLQ
jgi:hypothetical protein